jgi:phage baseplate assembly protein W
MNIPQSMTSILMNEYGSGKGTSLYGSNLVDDRNCNHPLHSYTDAFGS